MSQPQHVITKRVRREHSVTVNRDHIVNYLKGLGYDVPAVPKMQLCDIDHVEDDLDSGYILVQWTDRETIEHEGDKP
jgi:hypothetical protein